MKIFTYYKIMNTTAYNFFLDYDYSDLDYVYVYSDQYIKGKRKQIIYYFGQFV